MEQLLILLVFGGIALLNRWLTKSGSGDSSDGDEQTPEQAAKQREDRAKTEQERVRKFMEALGVPAESLPPPRKPREVAAPPPLPKPVAKVTPPEPPIPPFEHQRLPEIRPPHPTQELRRPGRPTPVRQSAPPAEPASQLPTPPLFQPSPPPQKRPAPVPEPSPAIEVAALSVSAGRSGDQSDIRALLRSRNTIRSAVLMREILGPPRSLELLRNDPAYSR